MKRYRLTMWVVVTDEEVLTKRANAELGAQGLEPGIEDASDALIMLIDRGSDFEAGYEIEESVCDAVTEPVPARKAVWDITLSSKCPETTTRTRAYDGDCLDPAGSGQ